MIGLGAKDDGEFAAEFVTSTGTYSFPVYWDETFESWVSLGISGQPAGILLSPTGDELTRWRGTVDLDEALALATG